MKIEKSGSKPTRRGPSEWFTGDVWVDEIAPPDAPARVHVLQVLHIIAGLGRVQKSGEPTVDVHPGDTVWIPPDERHWHGAAPGHSMVHLAVQRATDDGTEVTWYEQVAPADYAPELAKAADPARSG